MALACADSDEFVAPAYSSELPPSYDPQPPITGRNQVPSNPQIGYDWSSQALEVQEVRWFFEDLKIKNRWIPFMGGDSIALENQYRGATLEGFKAKNVYVRGKLYEVDVAARTCTAIYWPEDSVPVVRGSWFNVKTWQPLSESSSAQLEQKHMELFPYGKVTKVPPRNPNVKQQAVGKVQLEDCTVEWFGPTNIHAFKMNVMSKMSRSIGVDMLGLSKENRSDGKLSRGYHQVASEFDQVNPVTHLLFVVHGIAQKPTAEIHLEEIAKNQVHNMCTSTRNLVAKYQRELYPDLSHHRVEFLPIEWRSKIKVDEGVLDTVTLRGLRRLRELGNATVLDVLFYTSPLYFEEILETVVKEIHRQYALFTEYNPEFIKNGGKVSLIGHSLGSVICFDILNNYRTMDDMTEKLKNAPSAPLPNGETDELAAGLQKYYKMKRELLELEHSLCKPYFSSFASRSLPFKCEIYYAVGSPLGCFLAVRGVKPSLNGSIDNLLPKTAAKRFYNLFHPYDPVAFRLEPLLLPHYRRVCPVSVHHHSLRDKPCYDDMQQCVYDDNEDAAEMQELQNTSSNNTSNSSNTAAAAKSKGSSSNILNGIQKELKKGSRSAKNAITEPMYSRQGVVGPQMKFQDEQYREMSLEFRVDYEMKAQKSIVDFYSGLSTAPTAHLQYWESKDAAIFFLQTLLQSEQRKPNVTGGVSNAANAKASSSKSPADKHL